MPYATRTSRPDRRVPVGAELLIALAFGLAGWWLIGSLVLWLTS